MGFLHSEIYHLIFKITLIFSLFFQTKGLIFVSKKFTQALAYASVDSPKSTSFLGPDKPYYERATDLLNKENLKEPLQFTKDEILDDMDQRISKDFKIPSTLKRRVGFWFDIYTKYDSNHFVLHHSRFPWLIYEVVNIQEFYKKGQPSWWGYNRGRKHVSKVKKKIISRLKFLEKRRHFKNLNPYDKKIYNMIRGMSGPIRENLKAAQSQLRAQLGQKNFIQKGIHFSAKYLPLMEKEFEDHGLPTELTRIPFVESSFNVNAESKVGASGIWQIMPRSAREFMILNRNIDERNSPLKATTFARRHLKRDFRILESWPLAVTAYNHGVGGVQKALRALKTRSLVSLISKYKSRSFKFASRNFYTCFLAVLHAEKYKEHFFELPNPTNPIQLTKIKLDKKSRIYNISNNVEIHPVDLGEHNLDIKEVLKKNGFLPKGFELYIPASN